MSSIVIVCQCGGWTQIWAHAGKVDPYTEVWPEMRLEMLKWAMRRCPHCRAGLIGSTLKLKDLPAELRPYDRMTDRSRRALEWRAAGHDYPGAER